MDVKSLIQFIFASISMEILWSQSGVNAVTMPDCQSLGKKFVELRKSGRTRIEKYGKTWDAFFRGANNHLGSELNRIAKIYPTDFRDCANPEDWDDAPSHRIERRMYYHKQLHLMDHKMNEKDAIKLQTYMDSITSTVQDRIELAKFVEGKCDIEVFKMWRMLNSFEIYITALKNNKKMIPKDGHERLIPRDWDGRRLTVPRIEIDSSHLKIDSEDAILQSAPIIYQGLIDNCLCSNENKAAILKKFDDMKGKQVKYNKVFFRGVQRMKRMEKKLLNDFVLLKIETVFKKKQLVNNLKDVINFILKRYNEFVQHLDVDDLKLYRCRLRILTYQMNFLE